MTNLKNKKIRIDGRRIYLRKLSENDASQEYCNWLNDPEVNKYLETRSATIQELKWYIREKNKNPNCLFLGIFFKENEKHIGNIKLEPIDFENKNAWLGILIGDKKYWGKGLGIEAVKLLVDWAFDKLQLERVWLGVVSENKAAIRAYEKAGFRIDELRKKAVKYGGKFYDGIIMSITKCRGLETH